MIQETYEKSIWRAFRSITTDLRVGSNGYCIQPLSPMFLYNPCNAEGFTNVRGFSHISNIKVCQQNIFHESILQVNAFHKLYLTPRNTVLEKSRNPHLSWNPKIQDRVHNIPPAEPILSQINTVQTNSIVFL
jgi:hypothetical protein